MTVKACTTDKLIAIARKAKAKGYSQPLAAPKRLRGLLDPIGVHLISYQFVHGDGQCVRCQVFAKIPNREEPITGLLDVDFDDFDRLEDAEKIQAELEAAARDTA